MLKRTSLFNLHKKANAKLVPFAGWEMPVTYPNLTISQSVLHTRKHASLFDVSHMLQLKFKGSQAIEFLERLTPAGLKQLQPYHSTLSAILLPSGGILDDTILTKVDQDTIAMVVNAGCADKDLAYFKEEMKKFRNLDLQVFDEKSLLALQGPEAVVVLENLLGEKLNDFAFMTTRQFNLKGIELSVARSGYTGEDGFEISVHNDQAVEFAELLLSHNSVEWAGLGARDALRLEAGMCLYGHDLDETISPIEAGLAWIIPKERRQEGGFLGSDRILKELKEGPARRRVGLIVEGAPAREGALIVTPEGEELGKITSGVPSPCLKKNIAMGYVSSHVPQSQHLKQIGKKWHQIGVEVGVVVRGKQQKAIITKMPFVPSKYHKIN